MAEETVLPPRDVNLLDAVHALLSEPPSELFLTTTTGRTPLPPEVRRVLASVVEAMRRGQAITLAPHAQRLTTQQAADLLGISRPTLIKLLESGKIPYETPGRHRRIRLVDLLNYQDLRSGERQTALRDLAAEAQRMGLYDEPREKYESALEESRAKLA